MTLLLSKGIWCAHDGALSARMTNAPFISHKSNPIFLCFAIIEINVPKEKEYNIEIAIEPCYMATWTLPLTVGIQNYCIPFLTLFFYENIENVNRPINR